MALGTDPGPRVVIVENPDGSKTKLTITYNADGSVNSTTVATES